MEAETNPVEQSQDVNSEKTERLLKLPLTRIKSIMKMDPDVTLASQDAVIMIAKATVRSFSGAVCHFLWMWLRGLYLCQSVKHSICVSGGVSDLGAGCLTEVCR